MYQNNDGLPIKYTINMWYMVYVKDAIKRLMKVVISAILIQILVTSTILQ